MDKQYRQITHKLRIHRAPGLPETESVRPGRWANQDSEENPTLITLGDSDRVDIPALLAMGAIVPWEPPKPKRPAKEVSSEQI